MAIEQKIEQMYRALGDIEVTEKLPSIKPQTKRVGNQFETSIDFTRGTDSATAANRVLQIVANVACIKDHLKTWCAKNGKPFTAEDLINSNRNVAIIHDLWNLDKHAELNRPSRSGLSPRLDGPAYTALEVRGEPFSVTMGFYEGGTVEATGEASLRVVATVVDKDGTPLGNFETIADKAVEAWEIELKKAGVTF